MDHFKGKLEWYINNFIHRPLKKIKSPESSRIFRLKCLRPYSKCIIY